MQTTLAGAALRGALALAAGLSARAEAAVIWQADPARGEANFKNVEEDDGTQFSIVDDPIYGRIFKFARLRTGANRCEAKGAAGYNTGEGKLVYLHARYKLEAPSNITLTGIFQWKTYDTPGFPNDLNFPFLLRPNGGRLVLEAHRPRTDLWSIPTPVNTWFTVTMAIYQSLDVNKGWIEFWYNGERVTFRDGSTRFTCKTLAGGNVEPKWGIYGTNSSQKPVSASYITDLRLATDLASARMGGAISILPRAAGPAGAAFAGTPSDARFFDLAGRARDGLRPQVAHVVRPRAGSQRAAVVSPVE